MTPVGNTSTSMLQPAQARTEPSLIKPVEVGPNSNVEQSKVTLSEEGKALLAALQEIEKNSAETDGEKPTKVESFAYGALGLDHPEEVKKEEDTSYSAGKYLKGALSVGAIILALA